MRGSFLLITHTMRPAFFHTLCLVFCAPCGVLCELCCCGEKTKSRENRMLINTGSICRGWTWQVGRVIRGTHSWKWNMYLVTCPHTKPTQKLAPPRGLKKAPTHLPVCPFDCQYTTMPDLDESESWTTANKLRVRECREGTVCRRVNDWLV